MCKKVIIMKKKLLFASIGIIGLFLLVPFASAASSQVWFDDSTELVWRYTEEALDAAMQVTSLNSSYRKLNFTDVIDYPDNVTIEGDFYDATTADVTAYGYEDPTIWTSDGLSIGREIIDGQIETMFSGFFNELNTDMTEIQNLPAENQTLVLMMTIIMLDPSALAILFVYLLVKAFGGYFVLDTNSSTINSVSARKINFDLNIAFGNETDGVWENVTFHSTNELTYGKTSNVLLKSICTSTIVGSEGNASGVVDETLRARFTHDIAYP